MPYHTTPYHTTPHYTTQLLSKRQSPPLPVLSICDGRLRGMTTYTIAKKRGAPSNWKETWVKTLPCAKFPFNQWKSKLPWGEGQIENKQNNLIIHKKLRGCLHRASYNYPTNERSNLTVTHYLCPKGAQDQFQLPQLPESTEEGPDPCQLRAPEISWESLVSDFDKTRP